MSEHLNGTGVQYPTLTLGGHTYTLKFTRGAIMYRLSKTGSQIADLGTAKSFSTLMDLLHAALYGQYAGSVEDLAELVMAEQAIESVNVAIGEALKKAFPPTPPAAGVTAGELNPPAVQ